MVVCGNLAKKINSFATLAIAERLLRHNHLPLTN